MNTRTRTAVVVATGLVATALALLPATTGAASATPTPISSGIEACIVKPTGHDIGVVTTGRGSIAVCRKLTTTKGLKGFTSVAQVDPGATMVCHTVAGDPGHEIWGHSGKDPDGGQFCRTLGKAQEVVYSYPGSARPDTPVSAGLEACVLAPTTGGVSVVSSGQNAIKDCRAGVRREKDFVSASRVVPGSQLLCHSVGFTPTVEIWGHSGNGTTSEQWCGYYVQRGMTMAAH
jgi:hypothetical protein